MSEATQILDAMAAGDPQAADRLLPLVYAELRRLAAGQLRREPAGQTLEPTALVHEAFLRLVGDAECRWDNRGHFFAAAAEAMRRILIDRARRKKRLKRGAGARRLELKDIDLAYEMPADELLALDEALEKLESQQPVKAQLIKLRFFAGLTMEQAAAVLGISRATADRYWQFARAWLYHELVQEAP
jgi:RNA polymerase sigma factor (TIGR02999 family)